jgi:hypothetical protein
MQSDFRKSRYAWLKAVMASDLVTPSAKNVAAMLALEFANVETLQCNPSIDRLGEVVSLSRSSVKRAVAELEVAGFLGVKRACGRGKSSHFSFLRVDEFAASKQSENSSNVTPFPVKKRASGEPFSQTEKGSDMRRKVFAGEPAYKNHKGTKKDTPEQPRFNAFEVEVVDGKGPDAWDGWLIANGYPPSAEILPLRKMASKGGVFLPSRHPPSGLKDERDAKEFLRVMAKLHPSIAEKGHVG